MGLAFAAVVVACGGSGHNFGPSGESAGDPTGGASAGPTATGSLAGAEGEVETVTTIPCADEGVRQCSGRTPQHCSAGFWVSEAACPDLCRGEGLCVCDEGTARCQGNSPQTCHAAVWVDGEQCGGATPACTGAGVCAAFVLKNAGLEPFGPWNVENSDFALREQSLSAAPRLCSGQVCLTGGIR